MIVGYVIMLVLCTSNGQLCHAEVYKQDDNTIYASETECLQQVRYYNEYFHPVGDLGCGEVRN
ncbi:hypothetical protein [Serratia phage vB_SmaM_Hera]|uniref:Uncharacterized protein n=2 Tax=Myosmarvirus MTx TaxID=2846180 RepID=A0A482MGM4_9CAUD|nr:hypothetical protein HWC15_gp026 [Serratia phage MTx]QBQ72332.1 hypothetical protein CPT_MTx_026 [Serratia phage MTx]QPX74741.1 hypothetical protein [Serratia phage vB_SmaM_Hera]